MDEQQNELFFLIEKIVNIALFKIEKRDNQSVTRILDNLVAIFRKFWKLNEINPRKFEALLWAKGFYDKYILPLKNVSTWDTDDSQKTRNADELRRNATLLLQLSDEPQRGLTVYLQSFEKLWKRAFLTKNDEISRYAVYCLDWLLADLVEDKGADLFVEQCLRRFNSLTWEMVRHAGSEREIDPSIHVAAYRWYTVAMEKLQLSRVNGHSVPHLDLFNRHLFVSARYIISENRTSIFNSLLQYLVDGFALPFPRRIAVWEYLNLLPPQMGDKYGQIRELVRNLDSGYVHLHSSRDIDAWIGKFTRVKAMLEPELDVEQRKRATEIEDGIFDAICMRQKHQKLLQLVCAVGAYCLFKDNVEYVRAILDCKQPEDADATWCGHDILPESVDELIELYFVKGLRQWKYDFMEGHHGEELYYRKIFLVLLIHLLKTEETTVEREDIDLSGLSPSGLRDVEYLVKEFVQVAERMKREDIIMRCFGISKDAYESIFNDTLSPFFEKLVDKAKSQLEGLVVGTCISKDRVDKFRDEVAESFKEEARLRAVFKANRLFKVNMEKRPTETSRRGISTIDDKTAFFEEWYLNYGNLGKNHGRSIASNEDVFLFDELSKKCSAISEKSLHETLSTFQEKAGILMLATNLALWDNVQKLCNYRHRWDENVTSPEDLKHLEGYYRLSEFLVPIFAVNIPNRREMLILHKEKMGKIVQYSPLNVGEDRNCLRDIFYINVRAFAEDNVLLSEMLGERKPEWLDKLGDGQKQKEYLMKKVLIQIFERFALEYDSGFIGYKADFASDRGSKDKGDVPRSGTP